MDKVTLGSLCYPASGQISVSDETMIDYIDISSVDSNKKAVTGYQTLRFGDAPSRARKAVKVNSILVSTVRPNLNAVAIIDRETPNKTIVSTGFCVLDCKENVSTRFVFHYCKSKSFIKDMISKATGASYPAVSDKIIRAALVPNYSYAEQCTISRKLDIIEKVIFDRKAELELLDDLIKARFVEMFGDQRINPFGLSVGTLKDVADIYLGLTHTPEYVDKGKPFLSVRDISSGTIDFSGCHYISEEEFESLPTGARPRIGDLLFCRVGTIGKPVIVPEGTPEFGSFVSVGFLRKKGNISNEYLKSWMEDPFFMKQVYENVAGASQVNLNTGWLKNFRILIPPMAQQKEFADFVAQVDKSKCAVRKALDETQTLFDSLMQKYFGEVENGKI